MPAAPLTRSIKPLRGSHAPAIVVGQTKKLHLIFERPLSRAKRCPRMAGPHFRQCQPWARVIILSMHQNEEYSQRLRGEEKPGVLLTNDLAGLVRYAMRTGLIFSHQ